MKNNLPFARDSRPSGGRGRGRERTRAGMGVRVRASLPSAGPRKSAAWIFPLSFSIYFSFSSVFSLFSLDLFFFLLPCFLFPRVRVGSRAVSPSFLAPGVVGLPNGGDRGR